MALNLSFPLASNSYKAVDESDSYSLLLCVDRKLTHFKIDALSDNNFDDDDGDNILNSNQFTNELATFRWLDQIDVVILGSLYNETIGGCLTTLKMSLTPEVLTKVDVTTSNEISRDSPVVIIVKGYSIAEPVQMCYLRLIRLEWIGTTDLGTVSCMPDTKYYGGDFNGFVFNDKNGFLINVKLPTAGFVSTQLKLKNTTGYIICKG